MHCTIWSSALALGSAALIGVAGCSHNERPAKQATSSPTSSPTFESNIGSSQYESSQPTTPGTQAPGTPRGSLPSEGTMGSTREPNQGTRPETNAPAEQPQRSAAEQGAQNQAAQAAQAAQGTTGSRPSAETPQTTSESDLCAALTREGKLNVEDVQGGAAIVVKPRSGDITIVRQRAQDINQRLGQNVGSAPGASCELFTIARSGASTAVSETPESVRILITTTDPGQVRKIRKEVREYVNKSAIGAQGKRGAGSQGGPGSRGTQGSHGSQGGSQGTGSQTPHKGGGQ